MWAKNSSSVSNFSENVIDVAEEMLGRYKKRRATGGTCVKISLDKGVSTSILATCLGGRLSYVLDLKPHSNSRSPAFLTRLDVPAGFSLDTFGFKEDDFQLFDNGT